VLALVFKVSGTTSLKFYVLTDRFTSLVIKKRERDKSRRLPGLIEDKRELILGSPACRQKGGKTSV
jgi:hypothetical protein